MSGTRWKAVAGNVRWPTDEQEKGDDMGGDTGEHRRRKEPWPRYEIAGILFTRIENTLVHREFLTIQKI